MPDQSNFKEEFIGLMACGMQTFMVGEAEYLKQLRKQRDLGL